MTIRFEETDGFCKEFKRLAKKYRSLERDMERFKGVLQESPLGTGKHFNVLTVREGIRVVKARLACESLRGSSLRVIYAYHESLITIFFVELYYKGDKESEDQQRIEEFLRSYDRDVSAGRSEPH